MTAGSDDPRSRVVLSSDCHTQTSRQELTLFANGTVRLRDGIGATRTMRLVELGDSELQAYLNRLGEIRFDDLAPRSPGLEGDWVESCVLVVAVPGDEERRFEFGRFDTVPLGLKHVQLILEDLRVSSRTGVRRWRVHADTSRRSATSWCDAATVRVFEVLGFTLEGTGVELEGIDQPITVFVLKESILDDFDPPEVGESP